MPNSNLLGLSVSTQCDVEEADCQGTKSVVFCLGATEGDIDACAAVTDLDDNTDCLAASTTSGSACLYETIEVNSYWRPTGALNLGYSNLGTLSPGSTNAEGCCICESGCDHDDEAPVNGDCGVTSSDFYDIYVDRVNDDTSCATSGGEWLDGAR